MERSTMPAPSSRVSGASAIYAALFLFGLTVAGLFLLIRLQYLLVILFLALLFACGIAGPVRRLERWGAPRGIALLIVYAVLGSLLGALTWYVLPRVLGQAADAAADLPQRLRDAGEMQTRISDLARDYPILGGFDDRLLAIAAEAGNAFTVWLLGLPETVARALFTLISIFTIASLLLITKERLLTLVLSLVHPRHRSTTQRVLDEMGQRLGAYLRAKLIVISIVGTLVWATLFFLGSSYAVLVAIFAGVFEALPRIGPWIGRAAIFLAVLPLGWTAVGIAMAAHVVIENLKGQLISPLVESDQVDIHPLTAFVAIIAGSILLGWLGALIAVPLAAVIQVLIQDVLIPWRRERLAAADAAYALGPRLPDGNAAPPEGSAATFVPDGASTASVGAARRGLLGEEVAGRRAGRPVVDEG